MSSRFERLRDPARALHATFQNDFRDINYYQHLNFGRHFLHFDHRDLGLVVVVGDFGEGDVVFDAVLAAPLSDLPPQDGRADHLHQGEDDEADAGREEREEPEESGWPFNSIDHGTKIEIFNIQMLNILLIYSFLLPAHFIHPFFRPYSKHFNFEIS